MQPLEATPQERINQAAADLVATANAFHNRAMTSVEHSRAREAAIQRGLTAVAQRHGVLLAGPRYIDSNGDFSLAALKAPNGNPQIQGCAPFGESFVELLNQHRPRTGVVGPATLSAENGWCKLNHFDAEALVLACGTPPQLSRP